MLIKPALFACHLWNQGRIPPTSIIDKESPSACTPPPPLRPRGPHSLRRSLLQGRQPRATGLLDGPAYLAGVPPRTDETRIEREEFGALLGCGGRSWSARYDRRPSLPHAAPLDVTPFISAWIDSRYTSRPGQVSFGSLQAARLQTPTRVTRHTLPRCHRHGLTARTRSVCRSMESFCF